MQVALTRAKLENLDEIRLHYIVKPSLNIVNEPCQNNLGILVTRLMPVTLTK